MIYDHLPSKFIKQKVNKVEEKTPQERLREAALEMSKTCSPLNIDRVELCRLAKVNAGSFSYYVGKKFTDYIEELYLELGDDALAPNKARMSRSLRRRQFVDIAIAVVEAEGFGALSSTKIGELAGVSRSLLFTYFNGVADLQAQLIERAIEQNRWGVIAKAMALGLDCVEGVPEEVKKKAVQTLL